MACNITLTGIGFDCGVNLSGVKEIYVSDYNDVSTNFVMDASNNISTITMLDSAKFKTYVPAKNTGSMTNTLTKDEGTGVKYYTTEVVANFNKMDVDKRNEMLQLDGGQLSVMVLDKNNTYWYVGVQDYATATAVTGQTGAGPDDGNFFTLTITGVAGELPHTVLASAAQAVIA